MYQWLFLTHWGRVTHICVGKLTIIGSDNGLSPEQRQAIIWTNAGILLIEPLGTNFSETVIEIQTFSLKKICLKMSSAKCCSFRLGLNVSSYNKKFSELFIAELSQHDINFVQCHTYTSIFQSQICFVPRPVTPKSGFVSFPHSKEMLSIFVECSRPSSPPHQPDYWQDTCVGARIKGP